MAKSLGEQFRSKLQENGALLSKEKLNVKSHVSFPVGVHQGKEITAAILFQKLTSLRGQKGKCLSDLMK